MLRPCLRRAAAPLALAATLTTVGAARAEAQAVCTDDFLSAYLAPGFSCRLGHFTFSNFSFTTTILAATNATINSSDPADVAVHPFNPGVPGLGFEFFDVFAGAPGIANQAFAVTNALDVDGHVRTVFSFDFTGDAIRHVRSAGYIGVLDVEKNAFGGQFETTSQLIGDVRGPDGVCLDDVTRTRHADGTSIPTPHDPCAPGPILNGTATYTIESQILRTGTNPNRTIDGLAETALAVVQFRPVTVPEPATVTLLGGGLLGFAGVATRRRRG